MPSIGLVYYEWTEQIGSTKPLMNKFHDLEITNKEKMANALFR